MLSRDDRKSEKTSIELRNDFPPVSPQAVDRRVPASLLCVSDPIVGPHAPGKSHGRMKTPSILLNPIKI